MGNNLMLVSEKSEHLTNVYNFLCHALMDVVHIDNVNDAKAGLKNYSPAFILLDFDIKGLNSLLSDIVFSAHLPQPYIMIASKYRDGNDRANMLDRGADSCVDKPINGNEVIAVINSVLRRNKQIPIFSYKELAIHRSCRMGNYAWRSSCPDKKRVRCSLPISKSCWYSLDQRRNLSCRVEG